MSGSERKEGGQHHEVTASVDLKISGTFAIALTKTMWGEFGELARDSLNKAQSAEGERNAELLRVKSGTETPGALGMHTVERDRHVHVCVVFAAFAVEALVNHYIFLKTPAKFFREELDRLSPVGKFVFALHRFAGADLDPGHEPVQGLRRLFEVRNRLAHAKTQRLVGEDKIAEARVGVDDAIRAVTTVNSAVDALIEHDPGVESDLRP